MAPFHQQSRRRRRGNYFLLPISLVVASSSVNSVDGASYSSQKSMTNSLLGYFSGRDYHNEPNQRSRSGQKLPRKPTLLSGYGSKRILPASSINPDSTLWVRNEGDCLKVYSSDHNATIRISSRNVMQPVENEALDTVLTLRDHERWIGVEKLYGVFPVASGELWVWIVHSETDYELEGCRFQRTKEIHLWHIPNENGAELNRAQRQETARQIRLLRESLKHHTWYFTLGSNFFTDVTQSLQTSLDEKDEAPWWMRSKPPDDRFFWNQAALGDLLAMKDSKDSQMLLNFTVPVTSAFCGVQKSIEVNSSMCYDQILFTRRNRYRAGTRFTRRGADHLGNVANFAETEQLIVVRDGNQTVHAVCGHIQTRGSIPLRWSSPTDIKTYCPRVRIGMDPLAQARAVRNHLIDQGNRYILPVNASISGNKTSRSAGLLFVNLVDQKSDQGRLGKAMDSVLKAVLEVCTDYPNPSMPWMTSKGIEHIWYDFHAEVKNGRWDRLHALLEQVMPTLLDHGYCYAHRDKLNGKLIKKCIQSGVVRTNCMDCLDRTNVVQSLFGRFILFRMLKDVVGTPIVTLESPFMKNPLSLPWDQGESAHRFVWADNADAISRLYAGTPALKGDFTRTGRRTKLGALDDGMNSLQRFYLNNFLDADRQEGMDLLTGHQPFSFLHGTDVSVPADISMLRSPDNYHMSLKAAARNLVLDKTGADADSDNEFNYRRMKVKRKVRERSLGLRWLPGDLQSQLRSMATPRLTESSLQDDLVDIDRRAVSDSPWWYVADSSDESNGETGEATFESTRSNPECNTGFLLGAIVAGLHSPEILTCVVLALIGSNGGDAN